MKKLFVCFVLLFSFSISCRAAEFDDYYDLYLDNFHEYYRANQEYQIARSNYLSYDTLNSKKEAIDKTKGLMEVRDEVLISYFESLNRRLNTTSGVTRKDIDFEIELNNQIIPFLVEHKEEIPSIAFVEDLIKLSKEVEKRQLEYEKRAKKSASVVLIGRANIIYGELLDLDALLQDKIRVLKSAGKDVNTLERWLLEFTSKKGNAEKKINEAKEAFDVMAEKRDQEEVRKAFLTGQNDLLAARQYIREAMDFAEELSNEIKRGNFLD